MKTKNTEIKSWLRLGLDIEPYKHYDKWKLKEIRYGLMTGLDVKVYDDKGYDEEEMSMLRQALYHGITPEQIKEVGSPEKALFLAKAKIRGLNVEEAKKWIENRPLETTIVDTYVDFFEWGIEPKKYINEPYKDGQLDKLYHARNVIKMNTLLGKPHEYLIDELLKVNLESIPDVYTLMIATNTEKLKRNDTIQLYQLVEYSPEKTYMLDIMRKFGIGIDLNPDDTNHLINSALQTFLKSNGIFLDKSAHLSKKGDLTRELGLYLTKKRMDYTDDDKLEIIKRISNELVNYTTH